MILYLILSSTETKQQQQQQPPKAKTKQTMTAPNERKPPEDDDLKLDDVELGKSSEDGTGKDTGSVDLDDSVPDTLVDGNKTTTTTTTPKSKDQANNDGTQRTEASRR
mmetsp:Transcript_26435/g.62936  ORF Transcript_26435/g.62936 Transcript_26435/m.62936 type:complete len:108 (-) Transcript_26435:14-337(-)